MEEIGFVEAVDALTEGQLTAALIGAETNLVVSLVW